MKLRTDTIGHFESPSEKNISDAVIYPDEGAHEGDLVKLMTDDVNFISIWVGKRAIGHQLILRTGSWKLESSEKLSSEMVVKLMIGYLNDDLSRLKVLQWARPIDKVFLDDIKKLLNSTNTS
jgi:hypothetical protein